MHVTQTYVDLISLTVWQDGIIVAAIGHNLVVSLYETPD
jgi:hypothetical protein